MARLCKVRVNEFAIGFGKTILKKQGKETLYCLKIIPLGGFVRMEGEEEESNSKDSFSLASIPKRIAIVAAGGMVNIIFGLTVYLVISICSGQYISNQVESTISDYAAKNAGIVQNDRIIKLDNKIVKTKQDIDKILRKSDGSDILVTIDRNGKILELKIKPTEITSNEKTYYVLGVNLKYADLTLKNRLYYGLNDTINFSFSIIDNIKQLFMGNIEKDQLMGPVGISNVVSKTVGIENYLYVLALISLSLGVTNLLPFPPLDGGKILLLLIELIRKKPLDKKIDNYIQITGFIILISISIFITYNDILKIF